MLFCPRLIPVCNAYVRLRLRPFNIEPVRENASLLTEHTHERAILPHLWADPLAISGLRVPTWSRGHRGRMWHVDDVRVKFDANAGCCAPASMSICGRRTRTWSRTVEYDLWVAPCSSTKLAKLRRAVCRCSLGAVVSSSSIAPIASLNESSPGADLTRAFFAAASACNSACPIVGRPTPCRGASSLTDRLSTSASRCSARMGHKRT